MDRLVIKCTWGLERRETLFQAFTVAATAASAGREVSLWLTGDAVWHDGFAGDITITLTGLPNGFPVVPATVKGSSTTFAVKVAVPPTTPPGEIRNVKLTASAIADPKQPNVRVKSREVELTLNVTK